MKRTDDDRSEVIALRQEVIRLHTILAQIEMALRSVRLHTPARPPYTLQDGVASTELNG